MAVRDFFASLGSLFLLFAKIILCLLFAIQDRLAERMFGSRRNVAEKHPPLAVLEQG